MWWVPDVSQELVGVLEFNAEGFMLTVFGDLMGPPDPEPGGVYPIRGHREELLVVHGRTHEGEELTLFGVTGWPLRLPDIRTSEVWRPDVALIGAAPSKLRPLLEGLHTHRAH